jgi:hypothetical protein
MNTKDVDCSFMIDLLWKVSWPLRSPMLGWSGYMQMIQEGTYPGKSSFVFLPMIDLNPSDLLCIYSFAKKLPDTKNHLLSRLTSRSIGKLCV